MTDTISYKEFLGKLEESTFSKSDVDGHSFKGGHKNLETRYKTGTSVGSSFYVLKDGSERKAANILRHNQTGKYYAASGASNSFPKNPALSGHDTPEAAAKAFHDHEMNKMK